MRGAGGGFLVIVGVLALWLALTGKLDLFAEFWAKLVSGESVMKTGGDGVGGGTEWGGSLQDALGKLPNPPKIPASILHDPIYR